MSFSTLDEKFIRRCIELSDLSVASGDAPFGAMVVRDEEVIAESMNGMTQRVSDHAEVLALHLAGQKLGSNDLSDCTLYSNCEPCPMCAFMAREYRVKKIVFAMKSPFMGGYSRWNIMQDEGLLTFKPFFGDQVPEIIAGVLQDEAKKVFDKTTLWMFGENPQPR